MKLHSLFDHKRLVLFDFDGTLVDSMPMWVGLDRALLERNGVAVPDDLSERLIPLNEQQTAELFLQLGCRGTVESIRAEHDRMAQQGYDHTIPLKQGVKLLLDTLRAEGVMLGIVSASTLERMLPCIARLGLTGYFQIILPCGDLGINKNTPDPYRLALEMMKMSADDAVFVDDFHGNIRAASAAGLTTVGVFDAACAQSWASMQQAADLCVSTADDLLVSE